MANRTLQTRIKNKSDSSSNWTNSTFTSVKGELYVYESSTLPKLKVGDGVNKVKDLPFVDNTEADKAPAIKLAIPSQLSVLKYNGSSQAANVNYNEVTMDVGGEKSGNIPNTYVLSVTPKSGYIWENGTSTTKYISWKIDLGDSDVKLVNNITSVNLTSVVSQAIQVELTNASGVTVSSSNTNCVTATYSSSLQAIILTPGSTTGTATITITTTPNTYYNSKSITLSVTNNVAISNTFGDNDWATIKAVVQAGQATNYSGWTVGATKMIRLSSNTYYSSESKFKTIDGNFNVFIVDLSPSEITFQCFKSISGRCILALNDARYDQVISYSLGRFEDEYSNNFALSDDVALVYQTEESVGTWENILHRTLEESRGGCQPLISSFPSDLVNVMSYYAYDNYVIEEHRYGEYLNGSGLEGYIPTFQAGVATAPLTTLARLALPAAEEILGSFWYETSTDADNPQVCNTYDGAQFAYYKNGNPTLTVRHDRSSTSDTGVKMWLRNIRYVYFTQNQNYDDSFHLCGLAYDSTYFSIKDEPNSHVVFRPSANTSLAISPIFKICAE